MIVKRVLDTVAGWVQSINESFDDDAVLLDVRRRIQVTGFTCGSESAYVILRFYGKARSNDATMRALGTDEDGRAPARS